MSKTRKVKYLYERPFDILYRIVDDYKHEWYSKSEKKWLKDEDPDEDVYLYRKQVDMISEAEAMRIIERLNNK